MFCTFRNLVKNICFFTHFPLDISPLDLLKFFRKSNV
nr:MAG TPA: hypothetical protein [Caudoviricetes sp.]